MGSGGSKTRDLIDQIGKGDSAAVPELRESVRGDTPTLVSAVTADIKEALDEMEDIDQTRSVAKKMVESRIMQKLDINEDGTITSCRNS